MLVSGTQASVCMMQGMTLSSLCMECCGARILSDVSFTVWSGFLLTLSANAMSRIILYVHDLCGIVAIGLIFRLAGGVCLIVFHLTTLQHLSLTRSSAYALHALAAPGVPRCFAFLQWFGRI